MLLGDFCSDIENKIGYVFKNKELLLCAFTHSSYVNEHKNAVSYERLEFLGDAAMGYVVGLYLYETFPNYSEGRLSKIRANVVDRATISEIVTQLDIMKFMRVGAGNAEENIMRSKKNNCDLFEAIVGAIVMDNNTDLFEAKKFILRYLEPKIGMGRITDYKSKVWEECAKNGDTPTIVLLNERHSNNVAFFEVALLVNGVEVSRGTGGNKSIASQDACKNFLHL